MANTVNMNEEFITVTFANKSTLDIYLNKTKIFPHIWTTIYNRNTMPNKYNN